MPSIPQESPGTGPPMSAATATRRAARPGQARRPAPSPPPLRRATAEELGYGVWKVGIPSRGEPGAVHTLRVTQGQAGPCDCTAARFGVACGHRRDAGHIGAALDRYYAAKATIRAEREQWTEQSRAVVRRNEEEMAFAADVLRGLGYAVVAKGMEP